MKLFKIIFAIVFFWLIENNAVYAQSNIYILHSLFITNFTKHVQWNDIGNSFTIGVYASANAVKEIKANFTGKKFSGKDIIVISVSGIGEANACQLIICQNQIKIKS